MKKLIFFVTLGLILHVSNGVIANGSRKIRVCVIGAGPAGLGTTRFLAEHLDHFDITVFEKAHEVGGQWLYTNKTGVDEHGYLVHSSMYKNLRINGPKELTQLWDWPEIKANISFVKHEVILDYLKNYTHHFHLRKFIEFNTTVENVALNKIKNSENWIVKVKSTHSNISQSLTFDAVVVCVGQFSDPSIPNIPGLKNFQGQVLHSHSYRTPDDFRNKSVIILGAGHSGTDIGKELLTVSSKVYLSHNHDKLNDTKFIQISGVVKYENEKFILRDNSSVSADVLLFCTGYKYSFPFLDESAGITVRDKAVSPLYKYIVNAKHPSMSFINVPRVTPRFSSFFQIPSQAQYVVSLLLNKVKLPTESDMLKDIKLMDPPVLLNPWEYSDELAQLGGFTPIPKYYKTAFEVLLAYKKSLMNSDYKDFNLVISADKKTIYITKM